MLPQIIDLGSRDVIFMQLLPINAADAITTRVPPLAVREAARLNLVERWSNLDAPDHWFKKSRALFRTIYFPIEKFVGVLKFYRNFDVFLYNF